MYSVTEHELEILNRCIRKVAKGRTVVAACIYGSRAAGYARPDSDIDILVVLESYPFLLKYVYVREPEMEVSALIIDKKSLERDAKSGFLGEFVAGRLLHIYEPIAGSDLLFEIERIYKARVILEETQRIINFASTLSTEILFPLDYLAFSKIKRRTLLYPSATYSYYSTYTVNKQNLEFALDGYRRAFNDIVNQDGSLFVIHDNLLQISEKRVFIEKGRIHLKLTKKLLQEFNSYFVQTYAGRRIWHLAVKEAESKIKRHIKQQIRLPDFMSSPRTVYWQLPEGRLIVDKKDWIGELARVLGKYSVSKKRIGNINSKTALYIIKHDSGEHKIAVKKLAKSKTIKWMALSLWTAPVKRFKADPLFRLGSEYKALRYIRSLGLHSPTIEAVVLDRKLLVTQFIEGRTLSDIIKSCLRGKDKDNDNTGWISQAGTEIARIHMDGSSLGNIKPKNIVVSNDGLYFTDVEQFMIKCGDQAWDLAQFISWGLKNTRDADMATEVVREFLQGYLPVAGSSNVAKLAKSRRYIESFYPLLMPSVAYAIKKEIRNSI